MKNPDMTWYRLDLNPVPWQTGPLSVVKKGGKFIPFYGRNQELWNYQQAVKEALKAQLLLREPPVRLRVFFWRRIEEYTSHQGRAAQSNEADTTNMIKAFEDALQGIFYKNDKGNVAVEGYRVRQDTDCDPHIIVGIEDIAQDWVYNQLIGIPEEILNPSKLDTNEEEDRWKTTPVDF